MAQTDQKTIHGGHFADTFVGNFGITAVKLFGGLVALDILGYQDRDYRAQVLKTIVDSKHDVCFSFLFSFWPEVKQFVCTREMTMELRGIM